MHEEFLRKDGQEAVMQLQGRDLAVTKTEETHPPRRRLSIRKMRTKRVAAQKNAALKGKLAVLKGKLALRKWFHFQRTLYCTRQ